MNHTTQNIIYHHRATDSWEVDRQGILKKPVIGFAKESKLQYR